jgi:hypothetical protein
VADSVPVGGFGVDGHPAGGGAFSASENGVVVFRTVRPLKMKLAWFDRAGHVVAPVALPTFPRFSDVELSPSGTRIALAAGTKPSAEDIWVVDLESGQGTQVTFDPNSDRRPVWSIDGAWLVFASTRPGAPGLYRKMWSGERPEELVLRNDAAQPEWPSDWPAPGIVYERPQSASLAEARLLPLGGDRTPHRLMDGPVTQPDVKMSPDAKWIAYTWGEPGGRRDVFVQSASTPGARWRISTTGGAFPRWRSDGRELFYLAGDNSLMAVPIGTGATHPHVGTPLRLFATSVNEIPESLRSFGVSPDGERFLMTVASEPGATQSLVVVANWSRVER